MSGSSLWALADDPPARSVPERRWRWPIGAVPVVLLLALLGIGVMIPAGLGSGARLALFGLGSAGGVTSRGTTPLRRSILS